MTFREGTFLQATFQQVGPKVSKSQTTVMFIFYNLIHFFSQVADLSDESSVLVQSEFSDSFIITTKDGEMGLDFFFFFYVLVGILSRLSIWWCGMMENPIKRQCSEKKTETERESPDVSQLKQRAYIQTWETDGGRFQQSSAGEPDWRWQGHWQHFHSLLL